MDKVQGLTVATGISPHPLAESFESRWKRYEKELKRAQKSFSEESVHDVRVTSRRLLAALDVIETWVQLKRIRSAKKELKRVLKIFSPVRDVHVEQILLRNFPLSAPAVRLLLDFLKEQERKRIQKARKRIKSVNAGATRRMRKTIRKWSGTVTFAGVPDLNGNLSALARRALTSGFQTVDRLCRAVDRRNMETLHLMRVAFKKYRYMAEFLQPVLPKLTDGTMQQMHDYQTLLGDIHDLEVVIKTTRKFAGKLRRTAPRRMRLGSTLRDLRQRKRQLIAEFVRQKDQLNEFWPFELPASSPQAVQPTSKEV